MVEVVDGFDLSSMSKSYRGSGSGSCHPAVLLSLLLYGCATGVFSCRKPERATYDSLAFRFIAANDHPDHDTIAVFQRRFFAEIEALFVQVLLLAREMGVLKIGTVALDGTKIHANDKQQLRPMLNKVVALPGALGKAGTLLADNGYFSAANVAACEAVAVRPLIAMGREAHHPPPGERFAEPPLENPTPAEAMAYRLATPEGKAVHRLRKQMPEPVFGIIKSVMGFRRFLLRGIDKVPASGAL